MTKTNDFNPEKELAEFVHELKVMATTGEEGPLLAALRKVIHEEVQSAVVETIAPEMRKH